MDGQCGGASAQPGGADIHAVDGGQQLLLHVPVLQQGVVAVQLPHQGELGQLRALFKGAADAHAHHDGRAGVGTRVAHGI